MSSLRHRRCLYCCKFPAQSGGKFVIIAVLFKIYSCDFRMIDSCELLSTLMIGPSDKIKCGNSVTSRDKMVGIHQSGATRKKYDLSELLLTKRLLFYFLTLRQF